MKFIANEILEEGYSKEWQAKISDAIMQANLEYLKIKDRLPKDFARIYERTNHFDDNLVPEISIVTENYDFTNTKRHARGSKVKIVFVDYDNKNIGWEVVVSALKDFHISWEMDYAASIECLWYDEMTAHDEKNILWEILFSDGLFLEMIFSKIYIKKLNHVQLEAYKEPLNKKSKD